MARIRFEGVRKDYGGHAVLAPLDLDIADGEFFTFVGPSGCGKSTLLALVAGVETPTAGEIRFDDRRIDTLSPGERDVAMVFQSYALYPHLTVRANLAFPLQVRRTPAAQVAAEVARVAELLGLAALLDRRPRELSGGQRQRVALGRALVRRPKAFLMDEPLSNLDARLRLEMREEIKRLHASLGITTIYVTHDQEEAMALSGRMAVLGDGRIQQCGAPQAIYEAPANLFVARFVGSPPINVLEGAALARIPGLAERLRGGEAAGDWLLGVRPTDLVARPAACATGVEAEVALTEPTGGDLWVVATWEGHRLKARAAPGASFAPGERAWLDFGSARVHRFDRQSGARLAQD